MIVEIDNERVDIKHRVAIVLQNMKELGGSANTRDIVSRSGLEDWQVRNAFEQAEDRGLVDYLGKDESSYGRGSDPHLFELNGHGRQLVERGIATKVIKLHRTNAKTENKDIQDLKQWISRLESKVNSGDNDELSERFESLRSELDQSDTQDIENIREKVKDLEEYVYKWNKSANKMLKLIRQVVERELDVNLEEEQLKD